MSVCGNCEHWKKQLATVDTPPEAPIMGACREGPPQLCILPAPGGRVQNVIAYPMTPEHFEACDRFRRRVDAHNDFIASSLTR